MKNKVIVFDLDGTLLGANNEIIGGTETLNCLDSLQQMGWTLAICTGRLDHDILKIEEQYKLKIEHRISQNGAVCMKGQQLIATLIDKQEAIIIGKVKEIQLSLVNYMIPISFVKILINLYCISQQFCFLLLVLKINFAQ